MYKLSIPVMLHENFDCEGTLKQIQSVHAERVFLAIRTISFSLEKRMQVIELMKKYIPYFKKHGLETGIWFWSFLRENPEYDKRDCILQMNHKGEEIQGAYCPASEGFIEDCEEFIKMVAELEPDIIQFDDDYRLLAANENSVGCFCDVHVKKMQEILGEFITRDEIYRKAFEEKGNRYRHAIMQANGSSMEEFAVRMRNVVNKVCPEIRISLCSCMPTLDMNGTNVIEITRRFAGNTRPIMRLTGAPYWAPHRNWGNRLAHVIEFCRLQCSWSDCSDMEIMSEGDVYPRPRYQVPANYLECYDTALRFSGETDGILKYMMDYTSSPYYEEGYLLFHKKHEQDYQRIQSLFSNMEAAGVRIYNSMRKFEDADMSGISDVPRYGWNLTFTREASVLDDNSIPTTYRGTGICGISFGENARHLTMEALKYGLIIDVRAAKILMEQGVDVGLISIGKAHKTEKIHNLTDGEHTLSGYDYHSVYEVVPKKNARILAMSYLSTSEGAETSWDGSAVDSESNQEFPDIICYENSSGQKFMVFAFDVAFTSEDRWRSYSMQKQLIDAIEWMNGSSLPAKCLHHPDLYIQCKKSQGSLGVGLWNIFADEIDKPIIQLDRTYQRIEYVHCSGRLLGDRVQLSELHPYDFACFRVWEE